MKKIFVFALIGSTLAALCAAAVAAPPTPNLGLKAGQIATGNKVTVSATLKDHPEAFFILRIKKGAEPTTAQPISGYWVIPAKQQIVVNLAETGTYQFIFSAPVYNPGSMGKPAGFDTVSNSVSKKVDGNTSVYINYYQQ